MDIRVVDPTTLVGNCCFNGSFFVKLGDKVSSVIPKSCTEDYEIWCMYRTTPSLRECMTSDLRFTRVCLASGTADLSSNVVLTEKVSKEDPRVFCCGKRLMVTYSHVIDKRIRHMRIHVQGVVCDASLVGFPKLHDLDFDLNCRAPFQKNWTFFEDSGMILLLYNVMPFELFIWKNADLNTELTSRQCYPLIERVWYHPLRPDLRLRGGCPPIRVGDYLYVFTHSIQYEVFCIKVDATIYHVVGVSKEPVLPNRGNKKDIHFPCGAIFDENDQTFHVSLGIDDIKLGYFSISREILDRGMCDVNPSSSLIFPRSDFCNELRQQDGFVWYNSFGGCQEARFYKDSKVIHVWDKIGCHYLPFEGKDVAHRIIHVVRHPLHAFMEMLKNRDLEKNFLKLSNQKSITNFHHVALLFMMYKHMEIWRHTSVEHVDVEGLPDTHQALHPGILRQLAMPHIAQTLIDRMMKSYLLMSQSCIDGSVSKQSNAQDTSRTND